MLNIELNDTAIKAIMGVILVAMIAVITFSIAPKAYDTEQANKSNVIEEHKAWLAANTNTNDDTLYY